MEFTVTLHGAQWLEALQGLGLKSVPMNLPVPLTLQIGAAVHAANARLDCRAK